MPTSTRSAIRPRTSLLALLALLVALGAPAVARAAGCATAKALPRDTQPAFSRDGKRLAYVSTIGADGRSRIMVARADGSSPRSIASGSVHGPSWAPDGRHVIFVRESSNDRSQLVLAPIDGGNQRTLIDVAPHLGNPQYSPDGLTIALLYNFRPALLDADGSNLRPVPVDLTGKFWSTLGLSWSPDGSSLAIALASDESGVFGIFAVSPSGGRPRGVVESAPAADPAWSPDGRWIAYAVDGPAVGDSKGETRVFLVHPDGTANHPLPPAESDFGWRTREPAWRDARTVVYSAWRPQSSYARNVELHTIQVDGRGERRLTYHCAFGSPQDDRAVRGTYLADRIFTYGGVDEVNPGRGRDVVLAGAGNDRVLARDGERDVVFCGPGRDTVFADRRDLLHGCEVVTRR